MQILLNMAFSLEGLFISLIAAVIATADCYCYSRTLYASTYSQSTSVSLSSVYSYCTIKIRPFSSSTSYYLELSWSPNFDVRGNMPLCKENYIKVFLTSSERSIGKFCSNNAGKPFTMYSRDGYARITYSGNKYPTGSGFTFSYKLKSKTSDYLGAYPTSSNCYNTNNYGASGVIYSTGWPYGYRSSSLPCEYRITVPYKYYGTFFVFMDIDLKDYGYADDSVQLYGSNYSYYYSTAVSTKLSNTDYMKKYTSYSKYLKIKFIRKDGPGVSSSYRGFVAGYVMFKRPIMYTTRAPSSSLTKYFPAATREKSYNTVMVGVVLGILLPAVVIIFLAIFACIYIKRRQRRNGGATTLTQPQYSVGPPATQQGTGQQMMPMGYAIPPSTNAPPTTHGPFSATVMPTGCHGTAPYPMSYTTAAPYPIAHVNTTGTATPPYVPVGTSLNNHIPAGVLQPSSPTHHNEQKPSESMPSPSTMSPSYGDRGNFGTSPTVATMPNAPPPCYDTVIRS